jgi:hypothetical protein
MLCLSLIWCTLSVGHIEIKGLKTENKDRDWANSQNLKDILQKLFFYPPSQKEKLSSGLQMGWSDRGMQKGLGQAVYLYAERSAEHP